MARMAMLKSVVSSPKLLHLSINIKDAELYEEVKLQTEARKVSFLMLIKEHYLGETLRLENSDFSHVSPAEWLD